MKLFFNDPNILHSMGVFGYSRRILFGSRDLLFIQNLIKGNYVIYSRPWIPQGTTLEEVDL
jgi:hypothetical protein